MKSLQAKGGELALLRVCPRWCLRSVQLFPPSLGVTSQGTTVQGPAQTLDSCCAKSHRLEGRDAKWMQIPSVAAIRLRLGKAKITCVTLGGLTPSSCIGSWQGRSLGRPKCPFPPESLLLHHEASQQLVQPLAKHPHPGHVRSGVL